MKYEYFTCDVFTAEKFSGNQLAVFPHAQGLSENNMQDIAREFNFSETSFLKILFTIFFNKMGSFEERL